MRIVIDADLDANGNVMAHHVIHTDVASWNQLNHPTVPNMVIGVQAFLALVNTTPALKASAGYNVVNQLPGEVAPLSRWQRVVNACNAAPAGSAEKLLALVP